MINQVEGGNVYTKIEVEANGEKKILESSKSGKHEVEVKSSGFSGTSEARVKSEVSTTSSLSGAVSQTSANSSVSTKIKNFWDNVWKMISKIFRFGS